MVVALPTSWAGMADAMTSRAWSHTWSASRPLVGMGGCTTIRTRPARNWDSEPLGIRAPARAQGGVVGQVTGQQACAGHQLAFTPSRPLVPLFHTVLTCPQQCDGHHIHPGLDGHREGSFLEALHHAVLAAGALREEEHWGPLRGCTRIEAAWKLARMSKRRCRWPYTLPRTHHPPGPAIRGTASGSLAGCGGPSG